MEQDAQTAELYDFLYRDLSRFTSLYAQIFGGHLSSIEQSEQSKDASENTVGGGIGVSGTGFTGAKKHTKEISESTKRTITPHDLTVTDVLAELSQAGKISRDVHSVQHGSLVLAEGTLAFVDRSMLEFGLVALDSLVADEKKKHGKDKNHEFIKNMEMMKSFIAKIQLPSAFVLQMNDGNSTVIAGTIKDAGMEEPISSYYFKHGTVGLSGVYVIGIKELPTVTFELPPSNLIAMGKKAAAALHDMLFPKESIKVTPLALFRKL